MMQARVFLLAVMAALTSACATAPAPSAPVVATTPAAPAARPASEAIAAQPDIAVTVNRVDAAVQLLDRGEAEQAAAQLKLALTATPKDALARRLMNQIEKDPVELLGSASQPYVVASGDTMSGLADRFLGDHLMFFALSRYNGLASPRGLRVGQTLKIPTAQLAAAVPASSTSPALRTPEPKAATEAASADPAKASALRLSALENLNAGQADRAVDLLRQAKVLNPVDPAIERDLARALRVQTAMAGKATPKKTGLAQ